MRSMLLVIFCVFLTLTNCLPPDPARNSGWGSNDSIEVDLNGSALSTTLGISGNAGAEQQLTETASGSLEYPAIINSTSGTIGEILQEAEVTQFANVNTGEGSASSNSFVQGSSIALGDDLLLANLTGGEQVAVQNSGTTYVAPGGGVIILDSSSTNNISSRE